MKRLNSLRRLWMALAACAFSGSTLAQDCVSQLTITLENIKGGLYVGETVTLISQADKKEYKQISNAKGGAVFTNLPCEQRFDLKVTNYTAPEVVESPPRGKKAEEVLVYEPNMEEKDKIFAMNATEKAALEKTASTLKDTTFVSGAKMLPPASADNFICVTVSLSDLTGKPLAGEQVVMTGKTRKKSIKATTGSDGKLTLYLLKGDSYELHFKYKRSYYQYEVGFTNGSATGSISLSYMGTVEYLRRKKAEEERIKKEEERLLAERKALEEEAKRRKLSLEAEIKRGMTEKTKTPGLYTNAGSVVTAVLDRNKWSEKLIVCDLTGSMSPYASQLSVWYQLNLAKEKNLQFVFFNDGDSKNDGSKKIGSTGGIYYQNGKGLDSLIAF